MAILPRNLKFYGIRDIDRLPELAGLSSAHREAMKVVAHVLPFRTNNYVVEELIDWSRVPEDPIFQLTFPQQGMLSPRHFERMLSATRAELPREEIKAIADEIRLELNPHPAGQMSMNVPVMDEEPVRGVQRKYRETCLVFPSRGQTCHAYCSFCFRWAQFVGLNDLKFATDEAGRFADFVRQEKDLTDVLITGGDPMVMKTDMLEKYLEVFLQPEFDHVQSIRIGTKSIAYWPYRYVTDADADDLLRLLEKMTKAGKHLAIMAHFNHWAEHETEISREAIRRIRNTGAQIRTQSPLIRHINDDADIWGRMWRTQVQLGMIPYYMFIERDTGAAHYFELPLHRCHEIFQGAIQQVSGLARTARGPSMSATPGKVVIDGVAEIRGEKVFVCSFMQARNPDWTKRPFFAKFDPTASWLDDLVPAFGESSFFFEEELDAMARSRGEPRLKIAAN
ncbi:MAG: lysine 2,3-aminomutase [Myxococcota bacterium]